MMGEEEQEGSDLTLKFQHLHWQRQDELGVASLAGGKKGKNECLWVVLSPLILLVIFDCRCRVLVTPADRILDHFSTCPHRHPLSLGFQKGWIFSF